MHVTDALFCADCWTTSAPGKPRQRWTPAGLAVEHRGTIVTPPEPCRVVSEDQRQCVVPAEFARWRLRDRSRRQHHHSGGPGLHFRNQLVNDLTFDAAQLGRRVRHPSDNCCARPRWPRIQIARAVGAISTGAPARTATASPCPRPAWARRLHHVSQGSRCTARPTPTAGESPCRELTVARLGG